MPLHLWHNTASFGGIARTVVKLASALESQRLEWKSECRSLTGARERIIAHLQRQCVLPSFQACVCEIPCTQRKHILHKDASAVMTNTVVGHKIVSYDCDRQELNSITGLRVVVNLLCTHRKLKLLIFFTFMRRIRLGVAAVSLMTPIGEKGMNDTECAGYWQGASSSWHQTHVTYSVRRSPRRRSYWRGATNLIKTKHTLIATNDASQSRVAIWRRLVAQCGFDCKQTLFHLQRGARVNPQRVKMLICLW